MALFFSRYAKHVLVIKPANRALIDGEVVNYPGHRIEFTDGVYTTEDPKEIEFLRKHREFGTTITEDTALHVTQAEADEPREVFLCDECGESFGSKAALGSHRRAHKKEAE